MRGDAQLVLVDLPGVQRPRDTLTQRMQSRVERELGDADVALLLLNGEQGVGPGDRFIAAALASADVPVVIAVNKVDRIDRAHTMAILHAAAELEIGDDIFPISARKGSGVEALVEHLVRPAARRRVHVRRAATRPTSPSRSCSPSSSASRSCGGPSRRSRTRSRSKVEDIDVSRDDLIRVTALAWVEAESQKGILIGAQGKMIKAIGTAARRELERHLDSKVHLDLSVRVRRHWRADDALLDRLGIE